MSPEIITAIIGFIGIIVGYIFKQRMAKISAEREKERDEHKQERLEWRLKFDKLKIEFEEVKQQGEEVKQQGINTQSLIEVVSQLADGMGRADRTQREGYQQLTSAINIQTEAQHKTFDKLDELIATKAQVDKVVEIFQAEFQGLASRLDNIPILFTDNQVDERKQLKSVIAELMVLLEKATGIVETCKTSNNEHPKKDDVLTIEKVDKGNKS